MRCRIEDRRRVSYCPASLLSLSPLLISLRSGIPRKQENLSSNYHVSNRCSLSRVVESCDCCIFAGILELVQATCPCQRYTVATMAQLCQVFALPRTSSATNSSAPYFAWSEAFSRVLAQDARRAEIGNLKAQSASHGMLRRQMFFHSNIPRLLDGVQLAFGTKPNLANACCPQGPQRTELKKWNSGFGSGM